MTTISVVITKRVQRAITEKVFPGCVVGIVAMNGSREVFTFGNLTYEAESRKVTEETLYDVASITKSIPTASIAHLLIEQGKLRITDKLIDYIPEFRNSDREIVLIKHLLTYTLDGYGLASLKVKSTPQLIEALMTHDFEKRPGTIFKYSNIPAALLGLVVEKVSGETLDNLANAYFFKPLRMEKTTFFPEHFPLPDIAPTEIDSWRGLVQGVVHDESAYYCKRDGKIVGHAGLFSTAPDILNFLEMLLHGGVLCGKRYFSEETISQFETNQISELADCTGLGWELYQPRYMGKYSGKHTFGKTGFTGTLCVVDRERGVAYVILSNRTFPQRPADSSAINQFRADIGDIILAPSAQ